MLNTTDRFACSILDLKTYLTSITITKNLFRILLKQCFVENLSELRRY